MSFAAASLREAAEKILTILERTPRCYADGTVAAPESIDEPEGRVQIRLTDSLVKQMIRMLEEGLKYER